MNGKYGFSTYVTHWKDKDNVIISVHHISNVEPLQVEQVGVVELGYYKNGEHEGEALVWNLYVNEEHRHKGVAQWLMNKAHEIAKELGAKTTALEWSLRESPFWVFDWYCRLGYDEKEIGPGSSLMRKPLKD